MKLFLWPEILTDYTHGVAFAIAEDLESAKEQVRKAHGWEDEYLEFGLQRDPEIYELDEPFGFTRWGGG